MTTGSESGWNSFARTNASDRFRRQSATMGTPLTELVVREAEVESGMRVLDVACGTGEPAISIASQLNGTGEVIATDISEAPLRIGEQRARQRGLRNISFRQADVQALPFRDDEFDRATSRLGLMFFADLPQALREICRVLKPGGRFTAVAWGPMEQPYFEATIGTVLRTCPELALPASGKAMCKFGVAGTLAKALREAGFSQAHDEIREVEWTWHGTPEEVWEYFQAVTVPFVPLFKAIPEDRRARVKESAISAIAKLSVESSIPFGGRFVLAQASK
jgi:ubiquinone/menaquinone biosynthesis C-methylase UbiE